MEDQQVLDTPEFDETPTAQDRLLAILDQASDAAKGEVSVINEKDRGKILGIWLTNETGKEILGIEVDENDEVVLFAEQGDRPVPCTMSVFGQALENGRMCGTVALGYQMQSNISKAFRFISANRLKVRPPKAS
jgi:hypothetical protein